mgnify:FL=1
MEWLIVQDGVIANIIVAPADVAERMGALPVYDGAAVGAAYRPPDTELDQLRAQVADLQNQILTMRLGGI